MSCILFVLLLHSLSHNYTSLNTLGVLLRLPTLTHGRNYRFNQRDVALHPFGLSAGRPDARLHFSSTVSSLSWRQQFPLRDICHLAGHSTATLFVWCYSHRHVAAQRGCLQGCHHLFSYCHTSDRSRFHHRHLLAHGTTLCPAAPHSSPDNSPLRRNSHQPVEPRKAKVNSSAHLLPLSRTQRGQLCGR